MTAEEFLNQFRKYDTIIRNRKDELVKAEAEATSITSQLSPDKVQTSSGNQRMAEAAEMCVDIRNEIIELIKLREKARTEINSIIQTLSSERYDVLHKRYIQLLSFHEIAEKCDRTKSRIYQIKEAAIIDVQKILDEKIYNKF